MWVASILNLYAIQASNFKTEDENNLRIEKSDLT